MNKFRNLSNLYSIIFGRWAEAVAIGFILIYLLFLFVTRPGGLVTNYFNPEILAYTVTNPDGTMYEATIRFQGDGLYIENGDMENAVAFAIHPQHAENLRHAFEAIDIDTEGVEQKPDLSIEAGEAGEAGKIVSIQYHRWEQPLIFEENALPDDLIPITTNLDQILRTAGVAGN